MISGDATPVEPSPVALLSGEHVKPQEIEDVLSLAKRLYPTSWPLTLP